jgi:hypothetical protein
LIMANNKVVVKFLADTDQMRKGIQQTNTQLAGFSKAVKSAGVALIGAFGVREVTQFVGNAITQFADLEEAVSKTDVVFKENAEEIKQWAKDNGDALLATETQALSYVSTLGSILNQSGATAAESALLSQQLTQLVADLASFSNVPVEQAFTAVKGAIVGEREALKSLGFVITETDVKNEALTLGLVKQGEELTTNAKLQANISLLMKKTSEAQGDVARTGDSLANQMKKINNEANELVTAFGEGVVGGFGDTSEAGQTLIDVLEDLQPAVKFIGEEVGKSLEIFGTLATTIESVIGAVEGLEMALGLTQGVFGETYAKVFRLTIGMSTLNETFKIFNRINGAFVATLPKDYSNIGGSGSPLNEQDLKRTGDAALYVGSSIGYTQEKMTEWTLEQRAIQQANEETETSFRGAGGAAKDLGDDVDEAARKLEEEFQAALEETQRQMDSWRQTIVSKMNLGSAFSEANNAKEAAKAAQKRLDDLRAIPVAKRGADFAEREAQLVAEAKRLGDEAGKNWLDRFAEQALNAETLARNLANLDAAGLDEALVAQIASDANGAEISQAIIDGVTSEGYGLIKQINNQATRIENAGTALGETLVEPLAVEGAKGGENFLFGVDGKGKENNGFLNQVKNDAPKVKRAIKRALKTSVEVKVIYTPDTSRLNEAPGGRSVVRGVQEFERLNGRKWRDRVR